MSYAFIYTAFITTIVAIIWIVARKSGSTNKELEYAKQDITRRNAESEVLDNYINLTSDELSERVCEKRKTASERMHSKD